MTIAQQIITIVAVVLGTMATRFLPFLIFPEGKNPPDVVRYLGTVLPYAVRRLFPSYLSFSCINGRGTPCFLLRVEPSFIWHWCSWYSNVAVYK